MEILLIRKKRVFEMISNHIESKHNKKDKKDKNVKFVIFKFVKRIYFPIVTIVSTSVEVSSDNEG